MQARVGEDMHASCRRLMAYAVEGAARESQHGCCGRCTAAECWCEADQVAQGRRGARLAAAALGAAASRGATSSALHARGAGGAHSLGVVGWPVKLSSTQPPARAARSASSNRSLAPGASSTVSPRLSATRWKPCIAAGVCAAGQGSSRRRGQCRPFANNQARCRACLSSPAQVGTIHGRLEMQRLPQRALHPRHQVQCTTQPALLCLGRRAPHL